MMDQYSALKPPTSGITFLKLALQLYFVPLPKEIATTQPLGSLFGKTSP